MSDTEIHLLLPASTITGVERIPLSQSNLTRAATVSQIVTGRFNGSSTNTGPFSGTISSSGVSGGGARPISITFSNAADAVIAGYDATTPIVGAAITAANDVVFITQWTSSTTALTNVTPFTAWVNRTITSIEIPILSSNRSNVLDSSITDSGGVYFRGNFSATGSHYFFSNRTVVPSDELFSIGAGPSFGLIDVSSNGSLYGLAVQPALQATANVAVHAASYFRMNSLADSTPRTITDQYGIYIDSPTKDANTTVTTSTQLYIVAPTIAGTNWAIVTLGAVSFGQLNVTGTSILGITQITSAGVGQNLLVGDGTAAGDVFETIRAKSGNAAYLKFVTGASTNEWAVGRGVSDGSNNFQVYDFVGTPGARLTITTSTGAAAFSGTLQIGSIGAFAAGDKYLIVDASGNVHKSATGPAS